MSPYLIAGLIGLVLLIITAVVVTVVLLLRRKKATSTPTPTPTDPVSSSTGLFSQANTTNIPVYVMNNSSADGTNAPKTYVCMTLNSASFCAGAPASNQVIMVGYSSTFGQTRSDLTNYRLAARATNSSNQSTFYLQASTETMPTGYSLVHTFAGWSAATFNASSTLKTLLAQNKIRAVYFTNGTYASTVPYTSSYSLSPPANSTGLVIYTPVASALT